MGQAQERTGSVQADKARPAQIFLIQKTSADKYGTNHNHLIKDMSILSVKVEDTHTKGNTCMTE